MRFILWAIFALLCGSAGPAGWLFFWLCVIVALFWGSLRAVFSLLFPSDRGGVK
jgi:hypothetical protein